MARPARWIAGTCIGAALLVLPAAAAAMFPGQNGRIAFVSGKGGTPNDDTSADVFILRGPGDSNPLQLTSAEGQHRHPSWSPDLKTIAYARWTNCSMGQCADEKIYLDDLSDPDPPTPRVGFDSSSVKDDRPAWSPDGKRIAYESEVTDGSGQMDILVARIDENLQTVSVVNLTNTPTVIEGKPAWSPDGKWIYYSRRGSMSTDDDIVRERSNDTTPTPQLMVFSGSPEYQAAISPDGHHICYTKGAFGSANADVFVATLTPPFGSEGATDISDTSAGAYNCEWSPQGNRVAYAEGTFQGGKLMSESPNDSDDVNNATPLTPDTPQHFDGNPNWAPKRPAFCAGKAALIAGTDRRDTLRGTRKRDVIQAHLRSDKVNARNGDDLACGSDGRDKLRGDKGSDELLGGKGRDVLDGGGGRDKCRGGPGKDKEIDCER